MKKLMIAALAAAVTGGVFADNCQPDTTNPPDTAWVYQWKFSGKTTVGTLKSNSTGNNCTPGTTTCIVRIPGKVAIQGYTYHCSPACTDFADITGGGNDDVFWATAPQKTPVDEAIAFSVANVIGKSKNQFEAAGTAEFTLTELENEKFELAFAGLGKHTGKKGGYPTSISGYFAGTVDSTYYVTTKGVETDQGIEYCLASQPWDCATLDCATATASVAYGTWSVKFNSSAAKKYAKDGTTIKTPSWL